MRFARYICVYLFSVIGLLLSGSVYADTDLKEDNFEIYIGDVNQDGEPDIYYRAKEKILIIAGDITIPIPFVSEKSFYLSGLDGSLIELTEDVDLENFALIASEILEGDFNGDGLLDHLLIIDSSSPVDQLALNNIIIYGDSGDVPGSTYQFDKLEGYDIEYASFTVKDINQDGKDDILIEDESETVIALAQTNGAFNATRGGVTPGVIVPGAIAGSFDVGKDGSANYSIPIAVPPGGAGMEPKLAFSYSSGAGNGYLGMGWSVTQTSAITTCSTSFIEDGYVEADANLCLDGQRLIEVSTGEYRPANAVSIKVKEIRGGDAFQVYYKSGEVALFGNHDGNTPKAYDSDLGVWYLSEIGDRAGNTRAYSYTHDEANNERYLTHITYPGGIVEYKYNDERSDTMESWKDGIQARVTKRLYRVESRSNGYVYRSYDLSYSESTSGNRSRLDGIVECGADGTCLSPTTFDWSELSNTGFANDVQTPIELNNGWLNNPHYVDLNGDGFTDLFMASGGKFKVRFNNGDGTFGSVINTGISNDQGLDAWQHTFPMDINADGAVEIMVPITIEEGASGLGVIEYVNEAFRLRKLSATNLSNPNSDYYLGLGVSFKKSDHPRVADINGDGLPDILHEYSTGDWAAFINLDGRNFANLDYEGTYIYIEGLNFPHNWTGTTYVEAENASTSFVIDIDADGKQELMYKSGSQWAVMESSFNEVNGWTEFEKRNLGRTVYNPTTVKPVDLNGDGLTDILYKRDSKWAFNINQGGTLGPSVVTTSNYNSNSRVLDYDDDGLSDIVYISSSKWKIKKFVGSETCLISGTGCFQEVTTGQADDAYKDVYNVADFDGDGLSDIITQKDHKYRVFKRKSATTDTLPTYLTKVTNGYGLVTEFEYGQLYDLPANDSYYDKGDDLTFPLRNIFGPIRVVKSTTVVKDEGFTDVVNYNYKQLASHLQGLGSFGFQEITSTTSLTKTVSTYSQDWQNRTQGMLSGQVVSKRATPSDSWKEVSTSDYKYESVVSGTHPLIRHTYLDEKTETAKKLLNGEVYKAVKTEYTPDVEEDGFSLSDDFGEMKQVVVTTTDSDNAAAVTETHTVTTVSDYKAPDTANWIIGRVTDTTVTFEGTNRETKTRKSSWEYYDSGDLAGYLKSETIEPEDDTLTKTTSYTYNSKGLKETVTVSVNDSNFAPRSTTTYYDSLGRYPVEVVNDIGSVLMSYDPLLGLKTSATDINGNTSYQTYDGFGRPKTTTGIDGVTTTTTFYQASANDPSSNYYEPLQESGGSLSLVASLPAEYYVEKQDHNGVWERTFFDRIGNAFETRTLNALGSAVSIRTEYDRYGRTLRQSEPYFQSGGDVFWTTTSEFDALQRPTKLINQEGNESLVAFDGLKTVTTNELGQTKTEVRTVDGKLYEVTDNDGYKVRYGYDAAGNMTSMSDLVELIEEGAENDPSNDITTTIVYDERGRKTSMDDPNKGTWSYTHNAFGELVLQEDAEGRKVCQAYDSLGRMVKRIDDYSGSSAQALNHCAGDPENPQTTTWQYDAAANGFGKLASVAGPDGYHESYEYDSLGRPIKATKIIDGRTYISTTEYDSQSRPRSVTYPSGLEIVNEYNDQGALHTISKADGSEYYWKLNAVDQRGNAIDESMSSGAIKRLKMYTDNRGLLKTIFAEGSINGMSPVLQYNEALYDEIGNVRYREDLVENSSETAFYDSMNRLQHVDRVINGVAQDRESMGYTYNGNISSKWNVSGSYQYGGTCNGVEAGHNAVTQAGGNSYCYDRNGNMLSGAGRSIVWSAFGKPTAFYKGTTEVHFSYGPDRSRIQRIDDKDGSITKTTYVGSYERVEKPSGIVDERHYIGGIVVVNQVTNGEVTTTEENYLLKDNLGSVIATVNQTQLQASPSTYTGERSSFDSWGLRRNADWSSMTLASLYEFKSDVTDRGFTGHEQIDEIGLIHMNGRVYDPVLGRFISADPIIQSPTDLQSLNRFAYVRNNPLSLIDPSGFSWWSKKGKRMLGKAFSVLFPTIAISTPQGLREFGRFARKNKYVGEVVQVAGCAAVIAGSAGAGAAACGAIAASVAYGVTDGDFQAAARAGATAFVMSWVGGKIGAPSGFNSASYGKVFAHGVMGGIAAGANGGDVRRGALAGAAGSSLGGVAKGSAVAAAIVGGTVSKLSGGSFANGAVTGSFSWLVRDGSVSELIDEIVGRNGGQAWLDPLGTMEKIKVWVGKINVLTTDMGMNTQVNDNKYGHANQMSVTQRAFGLLAAPFIALGGVAYEVAHLFVPGHTQQAQYGGSGRQPPFFGMTDGQNPINWLYDTPGDLLGNTIGQLTTIMGMDQLEANKIVFMIPGPDYSNAKSDADWTKIASPGALYPY